MNEFESYRPLVFSIAYRMLGSAMEAEDMVQEAYLRFQATPSDTIASPKAFLSTITTRLCLDYLKSAKTRRETYLGPWLPEPIMMDKHGDLLTPEQKVSHSESISMAFLVLMESLTPVERAVFLLREVFDYGYDEIGEIVDKSETACRKIFSRAKQYITQNRPRFQPTPEQHTKLLTEFFNTVALGDMDGLMNLLAEDVVFWSDGGGKATAAIHPIHAPVQVAKFLLGIRRLAPDDAQVAVENINGQPAVILMDGAGTPLNVITIEMNADQRIQTIRVLGNPDKMSYL